MPTAYHDFRGDADGRKEVSTLKQGLYLAVRVSRSPYDRGMDGEDSTITPEANMKFAPSSVQILILSLLATFLLTACGDQTSRAPAQQEEPDDDDQEAGENPTPQVPVV